MDMVNTRSAAPRGENGLATEHRDPPPQRSGPDSTRGQPAVVINPAEGKAAAVVRHDNPHGIRAGAERDGCLDNASTRMPPGVGEGLLDNAIDFIAERSWNRAATLHAQLDPVAPLPFGPFAHLLNPGTQT